ncbi:polysaccharide deacetylase family protein [Rhodohalobacter sp. 614A]|uniref:polysaccharide deacetylase family protein n=1 Tax=Rhodohalobacter sp. 614A TaxID=2908649 RepID=UPI001F276795|nr:polysaccharide deacetylase family protein [Rhodohalobacter sp. 614A]
MKIYLSFLLVLICSVAQAQTKKMAITVDDLPVVTYGIDDPEFAKDLTQNLINTFDEYEIPAIGYVNEVKLYNDGELNSNQVHLLEMWLRNGYELGNHTYSHPNFHQVPFEDFTENILKGEKVTRKLAEKYNSEYQFFRHPYLRMGLRQSHADSLRNFLNQNGYTEAPVTIDNEDYVFALAYHRAYERSDSESMEKIGSAYVDYMEQKLLFYERLSHELFDRLIAQTLLTHASLLNARYMDDLAEMYQKHGYEFVSQSEVLKDEAYQHPVTVYGDWGISWIDRWALSQGKRGDFFKGDPVTPDFVREAAQ